jgi:hypothetical protein
MLTCLECLHISFLQCTAIPKTNTFVTFVLLLGEMP